MKTGMGRTAEQITAGRTVTLENISEDLLSEILIIAAEAEDDRAIPDDQGARLPERAARVSRRWRIIVFGSPLLWSRIKVDADHSTSRLSHWLRLSQNAPLKVSWTWCYPSKSPNSEVTRSDQQWQVMAPHIHRIAEFSLANPTYVPRRAAALLQTRIFGSTWALARVNIQMREGNDIRIDLKADGSQPIALPFIEEHSDRGCMDWEWPVRGLRSLRLLLRGFGIIHGLSLRGILLLSPDLEELDFQKWSWAPPSIETAGKPLVTQPLILHKLHSLRIGMGAFPLENTHFPNLRVLVIDYRELSPSLRTVLLSSLSTVEELVIGKSRMDNDFIQLALETRPLHLESLTIHDTPQGSSNRLSDSIIRALNNCPSLKRLHLGNLAFTTGVLVRTIKERDANGCVRLERFDGTCDWDPRSSVDGPGLLKVRLEHLGVRVTP